MSERFQVIVKCFHQDHGSEGLVTNTITKDDGMDQGEADFLAESIVTGHAEDADVCPEHGYEDLFGFTLDSTEEG